MRCEVHVVEIILFFYVSSRVLSYIDVKNLMCYYLLCLDGNVSSVGILLDLRGIIYVIIPGRQIKYSIIPNVFFFLGFCRSR